jgi:hypothetical protein|nr:MAG TPA: tail protein [Caudoviricetes sp.]
MLTVQNSAGITLAYLNNVESGSIKESINGAFTMVFVVTLDPLKTDFLYDNKNLIEYNNDLFRVIELEELHITDNDITISITAEHISYDLLENIMLEFNYTYQTAAFVMAKCLEGTEFRFIGTDITRKTDIQYKTECNSKQISIAIANNWQGELKYFRRDIELLEQRGTNRQVAFRFGKNLTSIKRKRDFAKDTVSYEVTVNQDTELEELGYFELGDTVRVIDDALGIGMEVRIVEVEKDIITGLNSSVTLGSATEKINVSLAGLSNKVDKVIADNEDNKDAIDNVTNTVNDSKEEWDKIKEITDEYGNVIANKINGQLNTDNTLITSTTGHISWTGNTIKIHDQPTEADSTWCMELGSAGWRIANGKDSTGAWRWRTMATGTGIVADEITSGTLSAIKIKGVTITGTEVSGGSVKGTNISGGTLNIGNNNFMVDINGHLTSNGNTYLQGNVYMNGNINWSTENSPVVVHYSTDGATNWHEAFVNTDKFARYSYDGGKTWTAAVKIVGTDGQDGAPGLPGTNGINGKTYFTWIKYANDANGTGMSDNPSGKTYIGMAYNKDTNIESTNPSDYTWSKFVGEDGIDGQDGIPGKNGIDGKTYYTWIRYADDASGTGISNDSSGKSYIGIAYNKETATESNIPSDYTWTKIKGDQGLDGTNGTNGKDGTTYYTWIMYADTNTGNGISSNPTGKEYMGIRHNMTSPIASTSPSDYTWFKVKGENGADGSDANVPSYIKSTYIDATTIKSPNIEGNVINGGVITGGYIRGTTIDGSTIYGGDVSGVHTKIDSTNPLAVYRPTGKVAELWGAIDGSSYLKLYDRTGEEKVSMSSGASSASTTSFTDTGSMHLNINGELQITGQSGFKLYAWNRTSSPYIEVYRSYMNVGNPFIETYIDGSKVYISNLSTYAISELEVQNMELQEENRQLALKQSEIEVTLMEKGVL